MNNKFGYNQAECHDDCNVVNNIIIYKFEHTPVVNVKVWFKINGVTHYIQFDYDIMYSSKYHNQIECVSIIDNTLTIKFSANCSEARIIYEYCCDDK